MVEPKDATYAARERTAWFILVTAFGLFLALITSVPLGVNAFLQRARQPLTLRVLANQGTVGIDSALGLREAVFAGDAGLTVEPGSTLITNAADTGLLLVELPDSDILIARAQVYGSTTVQLTTARTPRYRVSDDAIEVVFDVPSGRLNLTVPGTNGGRSLSVQVQTPHGVILVDGQPGRYALEITNRETQVSVQQGRAVVSGNGATQTVSSDERALLLLNGQVEGPLPSERNLLRNGDFDDDLENWVPLSWNVERADQPAGETKLITLSGEPALHFIRLGVGHADTSVRQIVDQDLTDFASLRLQITLRVAGQSLSVCGTLGSECPLTVVIDYIDANGATRAWQQGFYAVGAVGPDTPDVCQYCPPPLNTHEFVALGQLVFYDSDDLLAQLAQQGINLRHINSLSLVAAGHSFEVEVVDVALIVRQ